VPCDEPGEGEALGVQPALERAGAHADDLRNQLDVRMAARQEADDDLLDRTGDIAGGHRAPAGRGAHRA
jgi:hypothetical protein